MATVVMDQQQFSQTHKPQHQEAEDHGGYSHTDADTFTTHHKCIMSHVQLTTNRKPIRTILFFQLSSLQDGPGHRANTRPKTDSLV